MSLLDMCRRTARRTFGIQRLRPEQEKVMIAVLEGRDVLLALPTGFGKSLIYQVPAMILERPTIAISPLIALMADQERELRSRGVPVVVLHSRLRSAERRAALDRLEGGGRLVVFTTPETLESHATAPCFEGARPAFLCVYEAHCISEWGHDLRPSYLRFGAARERLGNPPALAITVTATPHVRGDIAERLRLRDPVVLVAPAYRANLRLSVDIVPGPAGEVRRRRPAHPGAASAWDHLLRHVCRSRSARGRTRAGGHPRRSVSRQDACRRSGCGPASVHAPLPGHDHGRDERLRHGDRQAGHSLYRPLPGPGSLEQYVQESGRAGRDGRPAHCILLFDPADLDLQQRLQALSRPTVWHLARVETALTACATEHRAPTAAALAYSARVLVRIGEVLLSYLEQAGLLERGQERPSSWRRLRSSRPAPVISSQSARHFVTRASAG